MAISNTKQIKVILLLAGYLFVVLSHIVFVQPQKVNGGKLAPKSSAFVSKNHNKFGRSIINVKKIYKTVISREFFNKKVNTPVDLFVATLLYNVSWSALSSTKNCSYAIPLTDLPVGQRYHLRI